MKHNTARWAALAVASVIVAACTDSKQPVAPSQQIRQGMSATAQSHLPDWFELSSPVVLALPGTVFADNDEANNRLLFGVENAAAIPGVQNALAHLGIPASAYAIQVTAPIELKKSLQDRWRPTLNGVQIHFGNYLCSLGFNATLGTERSFITASHCTKHQGGVEGTLYYQPLSSTDPTVIATEVDDPTYFTGNGCPKRRVCRYSDASRELYSAGVSSRYYIARTSTANNGSLVVTDSFAVTGQDAGTDHFSSGTQVNKVGRTTGWTQGVTTQTCVNTNVSGSRITQLCQTFVQNPGGAVVVGAGDSGSGVFTLSGSNATIVGILWGGSSDNKLYVFSPLKNIVRELGPINAF